MINKIKSYVDTAFENAPDTKNARDLKEEIISNLIDKYNDLIDSGKTEEEAYKCVISGIGDIDRLIGELNTPSIITVTSNERKKKALLTAIAIALYILSPMMVVIFEDVLGFENAGTIIMFIFIATATGILVYNKMIEPKKSKENDDLVEEFIEWKNNKRKEHAVRKSISQVIWLSTVAIYIIISFTTGSWHITWVIFLIAAAVESLVSSIIKLRGENYE